MSEFYPNRAAFFFFFLNVVSAQWWVGMDPGWGPQTLLPDDVCGAGKPATEAVSWFPTWCCCPGLFLTRVHSQDLPDGSPSRLPLSSYWSVSWGGGHFEEGPLLFLDESGNRLLGDLFTLGCRKNLTFDPREARGTGLGQQSITNKAGFSWEGCGTFWL